MISMTTPNALAAQGQGTHHHHFHHQHHPHHHHLFHHHQQQPQPPIMPQTGLIGQQSLAQPSLVNVNEDYHHHHHFRHRHHHLHHNSSTSSSSMNNQSAIISVVPPPADMNEFDDYNANMAVYGCYNPPSMMAPSNYNTAFPANNNYANPPPLIPQVNATMRNFNTYNSRLENMIASSAMPVSAPMPSSSSSMSRQTSTTPTSSTSTMSRQTSTSTTQTPLCPHDRVYTTCYECSKFSANDICVMREIINMGFPHNDVVSAVKYMKAKGTSISLEPLADTVLLLASSPPPPPSSSVPPSTTTRSAPPSSLSSSSSSSSLSSSSMSDSSSAIQVERHELEQHNGGLCLICFSDPINCVVIPCGHLGMCMTCAKREQARTGKCPVCRSRVVTIVKTFTCS